MCFVLEKRFVGPSIARTAAVVASGMNAVSSDKVGDVPDQRNDDITVSVRSNL